MKTSFRYFYVFFCLINLISFSVLADGKTDDSSWVVGSALTVGGDTLSEVQVTNIFDNTENEKLKAGELFYIYGGYAWHFYDNTDAVKSFQITVGYHADLVSAGNDEISFERFPIDMVGYYKKKKLRWGLGLTYHLSPSLDLVDVGLGTYDFDDALGFLVDFGFEINDGQYLTLRLTEIDYEINGSDLSGSNIGFGFSAQF